MIGRGRVVGVLLLGTVVAGAVPVAAQEDRQRALARELAGVMLEGSARRGIEEQVGVSLIQAIAVTLQERLNRNLLEVEWRMLAGIVRRFVADTLSGGRTDELAAEVYRQHFDGDELAALLEFQRSVVGRKAARLGPRIAFETAQMLEREIRRSPSMPAMLEDLRRAFPVLGPPESP